MGINLLPKKRSYWWKLKYDPEVRKNFIKYCIYAFTIFLFVLWMLPKASDVNNKIEGDQVRIGETEEVKEEGIFTKLFGPNPDRPKISPMSRMMIEEAQRMREARKRCYELGYYDFDMGYCKRMYNGTTEVMKLEDIK